MSANLTSLGPVMLVAAAPAEARAVLGALGGDAVLADRPWERHDMGHRMSLVVCGIGKVNAAGAVLSTLAPADALVLSVGVAGSLPGGPAVGSVVAGTAAVYADEGLWDAREHVGVGGFVECAAMGFPLAGPGSAGGRFQVERDVLALFEGVAGVLGPVATVSTCSGTDDLARRVAARTGAVAEGMEGAAIAHALARRAMHGGAWVRFGELRVISNTTGDRERQVWDLKGALARLRDVLGRLAP